MLVWKEILQYAKSNNVDIIYVTQDKKEDWWNISEGITIGPRVELRKEFYDETNQRFHMYTLTNFLSYFNEDKGISTDKSALDEIEQVDKDSIDTPFTEGNLYLPIINKILDDEIIKNSTLATNLKVFRNFFVHNTYHKYKYFTDLISELEEKESDGKLSEEEKNLLILYKEEIKRLLHDNNID